MDKNNIRLFMFCILIAFLMHSCHITTQRSKQQKEESIQSIETTSKMHNNIVQAYNTQSLFGQYNVGPESISRYVYQWISNQIYYVIMNENEKPSYHCGLWYISWMHFRSSFQFVFGKEYMYKATYEHHNQPNSQTMQYWIHGHRIVLRMRLFGSIINQNPFSFFSRT